MFILQLHTCDLSCLMMPLMTGPSRIERVLQSRAMGDTSHVMTK